EAFMREALIEAEKAYSADEVPVGAVVVHEGKIVSRAYNTREKDQDPSAHAEHSAIVQASKALGTWRLNHCTLYVTLEPCPMCAGLIINSRIPEVYFGTPDRKAGACKSLFNLLEDPRLNHRSECHGPVLQSYCSSILSSFFQAKRRAGHK
ncbi:MAG: nucleoside deaminase, partial [Planctomycetes bacterium]|nr:nucleoside deaminase [Planctomycetota bacterium]